MKQIPIPVSNQRVGTRPEFTSPQSPEMVGEGHIDFNAGLGASIIELFQEQSRYHRKTAQRRARIIKRYLVESALIAKAAKLREPLLGERVITLPVPIVSTLDFSEVMAARRSCKRSDMCAAINLQDLSNLLHMAVRVNKLGSSESTHGVQYGMRPYPSPGGLYPSELYVIAPNVDGLAEKTYRYNAGRHSLVELAGSSADFNSAEAAGGFEPPTCALAITSVPERATQKYGVRGFRFSLLEAGHLSQNLTLSAVALNLRSLVYGSFYDAELEQMLAVNGCDEMIVSVVLIGGQS